MDMSFSLANAAPLARPPLDYGTLLASLATAHVPDRVAASFTNEPGITLNGVAANLHLASAILGGPGWQDAARALGGSFALLSDAR